MDRERLAQLGEAGDTDALIALGRECVRRDAPDEARGVVRALLDAGFDGWRLAPKTVGYCRPDLWKPTPLTLLVNDLKGMSLLEPFNLDMPFKHWMARDFILESTRKALGCGVVVIGKPTTAHDGRIVNLIGNGMRDDGESYVGLLTKLAKQYYVCDPSWMNCKDVRRISELMERYQTHLENQMSSLTKNSYMRVTLHKIYSEYMMHPDILSILSEVFDTVQYLMRLMFAFALELTTDTALRMSRSNDQYREWMTQQLWRYLLGEVDRNELLQDSDT